MFQQDWMDGLVYASTIGASIGNLVFVIDSTDRRLEEVYSLPYESKHEMKLIGGAAFGHQAKMVELTVLGMAKVVEDLLVMFKEDGYPHNIWTDFNAIDGIGHAQMIRHLANLIKHHQSEIKRGSSRDADALINQFGFPNNYSISSWTRASNRGGPNPCPYVNLFGIQRFCLGAINDTCKLQLPVPDWEEDQVREKIVRQWIGNLLDIEATAARDTLPTGEGSSEATG